MYQEEPTRPTRAPEAPFEYPTEPSPYPDERLAQPSMPPPQYRPRRRRRRGGCQGCLRTGLIVGAMALAALIGSLLIVGLVIYNSLAGELSEDMAALESMEGVEDFQTTHIYSRDGQVLYEVFNEGRRIEVPLDRIPFAVRWAIVATEDDTFYDNPGFDPPSIARAAWEWVRDGEIGSGGSTITQQLVRQIVFDYDERNELTLRRKLKEAALAWVMTRQYTKDEILELYLNEVYFGNLAYGVEGAANVYFDKPATELTVAEAAFVCGLVQSPAAYDPYADFAAAKLRQRQVLDLMVRHGYLSSRDADIAFNEPPRAVTDLASPDVSLLAPHFTVEVRRLLTELPGLDPELVARGGLNIYTTLDMRYYELAEQIARQHVAEVRDEFNLHNAALVALNPNTGEVLAMLGSIDYEDESIDGAFNVTLSPQQPGSTMKPLTYAAALEAGWDPADVLWDVPVVYESGVGPYEPENYDGRFHGPVRLRDALANSYNIPAVALLHEVGVPALLEMAQRAGIESLGTDAAQYGLSLTLGGGEVTPFEMAQAFSMFANGGRRIEPQLIARVEDLQGNVLYEAPTTPGEQVLDPRIAFVISDILSDNAARTPAIGADSPLLLDFPAAAKTGTTNDYRDNWTIGYTPHLVVAVWAGNTDNTPMAEGTSGLTGAAPIWHDYMMAVYNQPELAEVLAGDGLPPLRAGFPQPVEGLEARQVCVLSELIDPWPAEQGCPKTRSEWFLTGTPPLGVTATPLPTPTPSPTPTPLPEGQEALPVMRAELEPGLLALGVLPLDEQQQAALVEALAPLWDALPDDAPMPSPPRYCEVPQDNADIDGIALQVFIAAPSDPIDAIRARNWAYENSVPIEPGVPCSTELIDQYLVGETLTDPATGAVYGIARPRSGEEVYGVLPIMGTALFDAGRVQYYKLEIGAGETPTVWLTLGETHTTSVSEGVLELLHADALPPGPYVLRLVLVRADGNFVPPYAVPITVIVEPTPTPAPPG
jgi:1A family penicillin-binding protein